MVKDLYAALTKQRLTVDKLWSAYAVCQPEKVREKSAVNQLVDSISLVRFQWEQTDELCSFSVDVARRFQAWTLEKQKGSLKFSEEQMDWLCMIRDHIASSISVQPENLDLFPFDSKGGLGKFYQLFGSEYESILNELNYALAA